jgi:hypothetical protein
MAQAHKKLPWRKKSDYNLKYLSCIGVILVIGDLYGSHCQGRGYGGDESGRGEA